MGKVNAQNKAQTFTQTEEHVEMGEKDENSEAHSEVQSEENVQASSQTAEEGSQSASQPEDEGNVDQAEVNGNNPEVQNSGVKQAEGDVHGKNPEVQNAYSGGKSTRHGKENLNSAKKSVGGSTNKFGALADLVEETQRPHRERKLSQKAAESVAQIGKKKSSSDSGGAAGLNPNP